MPLDVGASLGPYEIIAPLGAGGMGEVYHARDTRLDRKVAIKVLPAHLSQRSEVRQRFEREARTISNLSHPHICALYDIGREGEVDFLVMEYLEGESLASRLSRERLSLEETLKIAREIADALECAHRSGVVHRDLKPGNVMLTRSGAKLLDFGLAKMADGGSSPVSALTAMATERASEQPLTAEGTILGTFQYMAPEQLEGKDADPRTDIFALGAVIYEMATGKRAFEGKSHASLIASILKEHPRPISSVEPMTPPALDRLVRACMEKDPGDRIQTAHDVKLQLLWIGEGGSEAGVAAPVRARRRRRERYWMAAAATLAIATVAVGVFAFRNRPRPARSVRLALTVPADAPYERISQPALSPDGSRIAFVADGGRQSSIWVRELSAEAARQLPGTEDAAMPFWSPDGRMIAFFGDGKLKKVSAEGGPPQVICGGAEAIGGTWGARGIVFAAGGRRGLYYVPAAGGEPVAVTVVADDEELHAWPSFLPDGEHFVYMGDAEFAAGHFLKVGSVDGTTNKRLVNMISNVLFVRPHHVVFGRSGTLLAQRIDLGALELVGEPVPLANDLAELWAHYYEFTASQGGVLGYRSASPLTALKVFGRDGRLVRTIGEPGRYAGVDVSPDGARVAVDMEDAEGRLADVVLVDMGTGAASRFTTDPGSDGFGTWSPDGWTIAFSSSRTGLWRVYLKSASRIEKARLLSASALGDVLDWSPDGRYLLLEQDASGPTNFWALPFDTSQAKIPLAQEELFNLDARFSPDGRWIAYDSEQSGRREVYIQSYPDPVTRVRVSVDGGRQPRWRRDGRVLLFEGPGSTIMAVDIDTRAALATGRPRVLFQVPETFDDFAPLADGSEFLVVAHVLNRRAQPLTVVLNWEQALADR